MKELHCVREPNRDNRTIPPRLSMSPTDPELRDLVALSLVPGLGPRLTQALLSRFGSASAARRATPAELERIPHIGSNLAHSFAEALRTVDPDAELERV